MSKIDNFPYPTPIPAKIWGVLFGEDLSCWLLRSAESEMVRLISREIIFAIIPTYMITIPQRYRKTDNLPRQWQYRAMRSLGFFPVNQLISIWPKQTGYTIYKWQYIEHFKSQLAKNPEIMKQNNKKAVLSQRWSRNAPYIWVPWKFSGLPDYTPTATFPKILWAFVPMVPSERTLVSSYTYYSSISSQHSFARNFRLQFKWGLRTPNLGEGEAVGGRGWYRSKGRWWVPIGPP